MPALGAPELIIILVIIVLIFGVGKLPEVGQALGKGIREFRSATDDEKEKAEAEAAAAQPAAAVEASTPPAAIAPPPPQAAPVAQPAPTAQPAPAAQPAADTRLAGAPPANGTADYTVQSGDTLDSVAQRHGVSVEALMQANGYSQRDRVLYAGDKLQVPRSTSAPS